jgi:hypothetical protein
VLGGYSRFKKERPIEYQRKIEFVFLRSDTHTLLQHRKQIDRADALMQDFKSHLHTKTGRQEFFQQQ